MYIRMDHLNNMYIQLSSILIIVVVLLRKMTADINETTVIYFECLLLFLSGIPFFLLLLPVSPLSVGTLPGAASTLLKIKSFWTLRLLCSCLLVFCCEAPLPKLD